jgi:hypothetical protein
VRITVGQDPKDSTDIKFSEGRTGFFDRTPRRSLERHGDGSLDVKDADGVAHFKNVQVTVGGEGKAIDLKHKEGANMVEEWIDSTGTVNHRINDKEVTLGLQLSGETRGHGGFRYGSSFKQTTATL